MTVNLIDFKGSFVLRILSLWCSLMFLGFYAIKYVSFQQFPTVSFPLFSLLFCMESSFRFCSSFTSVVIKYPDQKQPKEGKGLFVLRFQVIACY